MCTMVCTSFGRIWNGRPLTLDVHGCNQLQRQETGMVILVISKYDVEVETLYRTGWQVVLADTIFA